MYMHEYYQNEFVPSEALKLMFQNHVIKQIYISNISFKKSTRDPVSKQTKIRLLSQCVFIDV